MSGWDEPDDDRAPICPFCGVTALPSETSQPEFVCENPDCTAFGESVN
jgi:hypothetical protein